jgi:hypothetical protein
MQAYNILRPTASATKQTLSFIKEEGIWYADLPEFLELGLGSKGNLMMVDGADTFLDLLSNDGDRITLKLSTKTFNGYSGRIKKIKRGLNRDLLEEIGHAPVDYGAYYKAVEYKNQPFQHQLWLCPVTEYVFGEYPDEVFFSIIKK